MKKILALAFGFVTLSFAAFAIEIGPNTVLFDHALDGGKPPVLSSCGTSPALTAGSTDSSGKFTTGSGGTTCTVTFARAFTNAPFCVVSSQTVAGLPAYSVSATAITFTTTVASTAYNYVCRGQIGG